MNENSINHEFSPWCEIDGERVVAAELQWQRVERWNREAACLKTFDCNAGDHSNCCPQSIRPRVFVASDVFNDWQGPMVNANGERLSQPWHHAQPRWWFACAKNEPEAEWLTMSDVRFRLFLLIGACPNLDFFLLMKGGTMEERYSER